MKLSYIAEKFSKELFKEGEFDNLGLLSHTVGKLLVCYYDSSYLNDLTKNNHISCIITTKELAANFKDSVFGVVVCDSPLELFYEIHHFLLAETNFYRTDFDTIIASSAKIHPNAFVSEKNVVVGENTLIEPNATIHANTFIGDNVIIRSGTVISGEGFEHKKINGRWVAIRHAGGVEIQNDVEIQSNCAISKSVFKTNTVIGENTKLDNIVHVAHNVTIGKSCRLAACAMVAGSVSIGDHVWIGPNASISSEIIIEDNAQISIGAVVTRNVMKNQKVSGNFAIEHSKFLTFLKNIR